MCTGVSQAERRSTVPCAGAQEGEAPGGFLSHVHFRCLTFKHPDCAVVGGGAGEPQAAPHLCRQKGTRVTAATTLWLCPLLFLGRAPGYGPPRTTSALTADSGAVGTGSLLRGRKQRARGVGSPRSHTGLGTCGSQCKGVAPSFSLPVLT